MACDYSRSGTYKISRNQSGCIFIKGKECMATSHTWITMNRLYDYLNEAKTYFMATSENNRPSVRPVGGKPGFDGIGCVELDGKLYFYTDNRKSMYRQMIENPHIAITFMVPKGFVRVSAECVFEDNAAARRAILSENKILTNTYSEDDGFLEVYYIKDVDAYLYSMGQAPLKLD